MALWKWILVVVVGLLVLLALGLAKGTKMADKKANPHAWWI